METRLFTLNDAQPHDTAVDGWLMEQEEALGAIAHRWFEVMRTCGDDVRETMHDGMPTACADDAAFAYVNAFKAHVNVGFFLGNMLADPEGLLEGSGKFMRHVKLRPGAQVSEDALTALIQTAYEDMRALVEERDSRGE